MSISQKSEIPNRITDLIETFHYNLDSYKKGNYNETQVRREFIDPFFEELGWDITNKQGYAEGYKDVIHEDAIKVGGITKAPDYCFRIGGTRKFFLEAKKPSVNIKEDIHPAYQLRRYGWSAKLPLSILTDFEEFAVYDCRTKPAKNDKASHSRIIYMRYTEYAQRWDEIKNIFSRESILKGSFDKYAQSQKAKKGTSEVDAAFLQEIERWRDILARNIALRNPNLTQRELNFSVQQTIDRIVFLRICEDRGIESYGRLMDLQKGQGVYSRLFDLFKDADDKYNSGLFHFKKEKNNDNFDCLTPNLIIDDPVLKDIFKNLYYPESPYEFSVLPADILGQVYEKFLGKVIRLTPKHQAVIEEKPEVRKAGGVYYTPTYIVDYIVKNTVGRFLEGKKLNKAKEGSGSIKILDPACGSGSFLIGAYQFLLDWHLEQYINDNPERRAKAKKPVIYQSEKGEWRLTTDERKRILLNSLYGVDIDSQAVEVTKLSLLLKVLEGENEHTIGQQMKLFEERVLPDLANNIKCGNSLIGHDFYDTQNSLFTEDDIYRVNAFDWNAEFPEIMRNGGFDAVIGNPPYVDIKALPNSEVNYLFSEYSCANNRINLFAIFIEKMLTIVNPKNFRFSMIVPTALITQDSYKILRKTILEKYHLRNIVRLPNESFGDVIGDVKVDTVILIFSELKENNKNVEIIAYEGYKRIDEINPKNAKVHALINQDIWNEDEDCVWSINSCDNEHILISKIEKNKVVLKNYCDFALGITPYDKYKGHSQIQIKEKVFHANYKKDSTFKKLLAGNDIRRYFVEWNGESWISYGEWLGAPREQRFFIQKHIIVKQIIDWSSKRIWSTITDDELYNTQNAFNLLQKSNLTLEYILGILNSKLLNFYHQKKYLDEFKMRFQKILIKDCKRFPIRPIDFNSPTDKSLHDQMVSLVQLMLDLHKKLNESNLQQERTVITRQIEATDRQIDQLVYKLYDLTDDEIKIVEGKQQ